MIPLSSSYMAPANKGRRYLHAWYVDGVSVSYTHLDVYKRQVFENPNSIECIRCGACKKACPHGAIESTFEQWIHAKKKSEKNTV